MYKHIGVLAGLIVISFGLALYDSSDRQVSFDKEKFIIADTSDVHEIEIKRGDKVLTVEQSVDGWLINDSLAVDPSLVRLLKTIMSQVNIVRPVSALNSEEIKSDLLKNGTLVTIKMKSSELSFYAGGNATKTRGYFATQDLTEIYVVGIPGYRNYLSGIYELTANQWRERGLFASTWRSIRTLEIEYSSSDQSDLDIYFDKKMLAVKNVSSLDTAKFMNYIEQYEYFLLNDYLDRGDYLEYDSLSETAPFAKLYLSDIDESKNRVLRFFPLPAKQQFYLILDQNDQMIVVDKVRVEKLLRGPKYFHSE